MESTRSGFFLSGLALCLAVTILSGAKTARAADPCDPAALQAAMSACGFDFGCITQATNDFNAQCLGGGTPPPQPQPAPQEAAPVDPLQQQIDACGTDLNCLNQLMQGAMGGAQGTLPPSPGGGTPPPPPPGGSGMGGNPFAQCGNDPACIQQAVQGMQQGGGQGGGQGSGGPTGDLPGQWTASDNSDLDFDTTQRMHEQTVLPASWLQTYQEALVTCAADADCWTREMAGSEQTIRSRCGTNLMNEATMICTVSAKYEVQIEQAIAQQHLWRQGVRFEQNTAAQTGTGGGQGGTPPPAGGGTGNVTPAVSQDGNDIYAVDFVPDVSENTVRRILERWNGRLESSVAAEARDRIDDSAAAYPLTTDPGTPALVYEETEGPDGIDISAHPTRRDWAYALTGVLLTDAAFNEQGQRAKTLLDIAFWSMLQAAGLELEADHLSNIGFFLNLKGALDEAEKVLAYARKLQPDNADADNNLAFTMAAMGKDDEALALQAEAARLDPGDAHINSRLDAMAQTAGRPATEAVPYGGDFGEAFFRLGKRHTLREYWAGKEWFKARELAKGQTMGGTPPVSGPHEWYHKRLQDISDAQSACIKNAPPVLRGCPFGTFVYHPSCKDAPSPEQVARSQHNHEAAVCRCDATALQHRADAITAYVDRIIAVWTAHEKLWWPRLQRMVRLWSSDISATNARYPQGVFQFPLEAGYSFWPGEYKEDSDDFWTYDLPGAVEKWYDLKTQAQNLKPCKTSLPPIKDPPKPPKPEPEKKVRSYGVNLFVVKFEVRMDGSFKFNFDLGVIKGGYEKLIGNRGHKFEIGSGPVELAYQTNSAPRPGGDSSRFSVTVTANFFSFVPGAGQAAATAMDQVYSLGAKYEVGWGNRSGFTGQASTESQSKFGFTTTDVSVPRYARLQN